MINFQEILSDKSTKPKAKTECISNWLMENPSQLHQLISFASSAKDPARATCIEAIEYVTKTNPEAANEDCLKFVTQSLLCKAPRVKWESARVIGNTAHLFAGKLDEAITNLLVNAEHPGTVVRWSSAYALGQIIKMKSKRNELLLPAIETICNREEKNSIKKIYVDALKKAK